MKSRANVACGGFFFLLCCAPHSQGVKVTDDDLEELVKSLGLGDNDAKDLVGGLNFSMPAPAGTKSSSAPEPPKFQSSPSSSGAHHVSEEATVSGGEEVDEPEELDSDTDVSDVGELPPAPRLRPGVETRRRTDERPMASPLASSGSLQPFQSEIQGLKTRPPKTPQPQPPDTPQ